VACKAIVGDVHFSERDELLGRGLDTAPTLGNPGAVAENECGDNLIGDGQTSLFRLEILDLEGNAFREELLAPDGIKVLPPRRRLVPGFLAPAFNDFVTMCIVMEERNYGHGHSFGVVGTSLTANFSTTDTGTLALVHTSLKSVLAVFVGGLAGSAARIGITLAAGQIDDYWWPYPTLVINLVGSFALGYLVARGMPSLPVWLRLGVTTGFLGAFTTLSAISLDVAVPIVRHGVGPLLVMGSYAAGSIIVGLVCAIAGLRLGARGLAAS
jgi:CrcB protein